MKSRAQVEASPRSCLPLLFPLGAHAQCDTVRPGRIRGLFEFNMTPGQSNYYLTTSWHTTRNQAHHHVSKTTRKTKPVDAGPTGATAVDGRRRESPASIRLLIISVEIEMAQGHDVQQGSRSAPVQTQFKPPPAAEEAILNPCPREGATPTVEDSRERRQFGVVGSSSPPPAQRARRPPQNPRDPGWESKRQAARLACTQLGNSESRIPVMLVLAPLQPQPHPWSPGAISSPRSLGDPTLEIPCPIWTRLPSFAGVPRLFSYRRPSQTVLARPSKKREMFSRFLDSMSLKTGQTNEDMRSKTPVSVSVLTRPSLLGNPYFSEERQGRTDTQRESCIH